MRILLLTLLDYRREPNQRIHHFVRHVAPHCRALTVCYATSALERRLGGLARRALQPGVTAWTDGLVRFLEVTPLWFPRRWGRALGSLRDRQDILSLLRVARRHLEEPVDLCVAVGPFAALAAIRLRGHGLVGGVVYEDMDYEPGFAAHAWHARDRVRQEAAAARGADLVISAGERLSALRRTQGARRHVWIPNGVDTERFRATGATPHRPALIYTGNLDRYYSGLKQVIAALPGIREACSDVRLILVGRGQAAEEAALRRHAAALGVGALIEWVGPLPYSHLPQHLHRADVGLAAFPPGPSREYAFPYKVLEYMAAGLPVLATAGSETACLLERAECGMAVAHEPAALAAAARTLLADADLRARLGQKGRRASEAYDWKRIMDREMEALRGLFGGTASEGTR